MIDYMVRDTLWNDYIIFKTEEEARSYIAASLEDHSDYRESDFIIYKRERLA